jgi:hypothetical protein
MTRGSISSSRAVFQSISHSPCRGRQIPPAALIRACNSVSRYATATFGADVEIR